MLKKAIGWAAVFLSVFALAPSFVPGAMLLIGLVISLFALALSLVSVESKRSWLFSAVLFVVLIGLFLVNDTLRIFGSLPNVPLQFKAIAYGLTFLVITTCVVANRNMTLNDKGKE